MGVLKFELKPVITVRIHSTIKFLVLVPLGTSRPHRAICLRVIFLDIVWLSTQDRKNIQIIHF